MNSQVFPQLLFTNLLQLTCFVAGVREIKKLKAREITVFLSTKGAGGKGKGLLNSTKNDFLMAKQRAQRLKNTVSLLIDGM